MRQTATQIENETQVGGNTASRVGGLFNDMVDKLEEDELAAILDDVPTSGSQKGVKSGGVYGTTPTNTNTTDSSDLCITDEGGNILVLFKEGEIETNKFRSKDTVIESNTSESVDLDITDGEGYILARFKNGNFETRKFKSNGVNSHIQFGRGGSSDSIITGVPSASDIKIFSTIEEIINGSPYADIILISNFYAGQTIERNAKRRAYREELKAVTDFYSLGLIELQGLGIIRVGVDTVGYYTYDGTHAYTTEGATKIYNYIKGILSARYNGDLSGRNILILGDSSCIENPTQGDRTTWAKMLKADLGTVTINAVSGSSWLYKSNGQLDTQNTVSQQYARATGTFDIIIITAGGNELDKFKLDYASTLNYLINK